MSRIPLAIGTLKERKERQAKADANLALEIANSAKLARASRDYWVNGQTPTPKYPTRLYDQRNFTGQQ